MPKIDYTKLDIAQIFLTYMSLVGDVDRVAAALDLDPAVVSHLADKEGWDAKVRRVSLMSKSGKPGDYERAQNRALNFVQAHRIRMVIDKMIAAYQEKTGAELLATFATHDKAGELHPSARFLADIAAACEKVQALSYAALGDTVKERTDRLSEDDGGMNPNAIHAAVIAALNRGGACTPEPKELIAEASDPARLALPTERNSPEATSPDPGPDGVTK